ncbi:hypothetical protein ACFL2S_08345 [Thermodesulfobacteriota bacterium]
MSVKYKVDQSTQLGTIIVRGKISPNEIIDVIESIYQFMPINNVLWDFRYADPQPLIISNDLENIAVNFKKTYTNLKNIGKTAIVVSTDLWFCFVRIFMKFEENKKVSHSIQIFRFMDDATKWLGSVR